jgi:uncharacterized protein (TIGR02145 family)
MKKLFLTIILAVLVHTLQAQPPLVRFNFNDGGYLHLTLAEIDSMDVELSSDSLYLVYQDTITGQYDTIDLANVWNMMFADSSRIAFVYSDTIIYQDLAVIDSMEFVEPEPPQGETVTIGDQVWMRYNLDVTTYRNGDIIPEVMFDTEWDSLTTGAWCYYENVPGTGTIYGKLYNWYAVNDPRGLAPEGWRIPTHDDWHELVVMTGGEDVAGGNLKVADTLIWWSPNTGATDSIHFSALPAGMRNFDGAFDFLGQYTAWWAEEYDSLFSFVLWLAYDSAAARQVVLQKQCGLSVRCLKE